MQRANKLQMLFLDFIKYLNERGVITKCLPYESFESFKRFYYSKSKFSI